MTPALHRYLVFAGDNYYPNGGVLDLRAACDDLNEVPALLAAVRPDSSGSWAHVYDVSTCQTVQLYENRLTWDAQDRAVYPAWALVVKRSL